MFLILSFFSLLTVYFVYDFYNNNNKQVPALNLFVSV